MRPRTLALALALAGVVVAGLVVAITVRDSTPFRGEYCVAEVGETRAQIDLEQAQWTSLMSATAQQRGLPPRATTIAIATAFQESKIRNIDYGDRDSLGLFQQRPSQGWGTPEQIMDPHYAIGAFYDGLEKIDYLDMEVNDAAQEVQRSGFPEAYAQHETYARALASSLRGFSPAGFSCQLTPTSGGSVEAVRADVEAAFGTVDLAADDRTLSFALSGDDERRRADGWSLAHYLVGNAAQLRLADIAFDGRRWTAEDSPDGWLRADAPADTVVVTLG